jgi:hypothetical protein
MRSLALILLAILLSTTAQAQTSRQLNANDINVAFSVPGTFLALGNQADWLSTYAYGFNGTPMRVQSPVAGASITGASRAKESGGGATATIGLMGWGFGDGTGSVASQAVWGIYGEARKYPTSTGYAVGQELDVTDLSGSLVTTNPYNPFQPGSTGALHLASGGGATSSTKAYNPATGLNDLVSGTASYGLLISANGSTFNTGILFDAAAINGADGTDTGGAANAISMARGHLIGWYATGNLQKFAIGSSAKAADISGALTWSNSGLTVQNGGGAMLFQMYPGASAVNGIGLISQTTGVAPQISAIGSDTNIDLQLVPQGTGAVKVTNRLQLLTTYTVATLPTCNAGLKATLAVVTDANAPTYNAPVTGSGAVTIPVFCNGTNWTAH